MKIEKKFDEFSKAISYHHFQAVYIMFYRVLCYFCVEFCFLLFYIIFLLLFYLLLLLLFVWLCGSLTHDICILHTFIHILFLYVIKSNKHRNTHRHRVVSCVWVFFNSSRLLALLFSFLVSFFIFFLYSLVCSLFLIQWLLLLFPFFFVFFCCFLCR